MGRGFRRRGARWLAAIAVVGVAAVVAGPRLYAIEPVSHFHDLVAGAGVAGFRDGAFYEARFRSPMGLAVLARRGLVVVADRENHRIRAIHMNEHNRVDTLAGSGTPGSVDGALAVATFHRPSAIAAISEDAVVVHDEGSALLRLVDLATGRVETIAGNGSRGAGDGAARAVPLGGVWNILFVPGENALYFTQPDEHLLRRLDMASRSVETVLTNNASVPRPAALALFGGRVCVGDRGGTIMRLGARPPGPSPAANSVSMEGLGRVKVFALAASGGQLYATYFVGEWEFAWTNVTTGEIGTPPRPIPDAPSMAWLRAFEDGPGGFVSDPAGERSFFLIVPGIHAVVEFKDYRFRALAGSASDSQNGLIDFAYPEPKPVGTFRILVIGDSRMYAGATELTRIEVVPKRIEILLNSQSALDDGGTRFEVLALTRASWEPLLVWPNYHAFDVVKRFDVDLVLLMQPPATTTVDAYIERPTTAAGIPVDGVDPEYVLEPFSKKIRGNPAAPFVERGRALGWLKPHAKDQYHVEAEISQVMTDPAAERELLKLFARPLGAMREGIRGARPATVFAICYYPFSGRGSGVVERAFWRQLARMTGSAFLDTIDAFTALKDTWQPYAEQGGFEHFSPQGHAFFAFVVTHELLASGLVPFKTGGGVRLKAVEPPKRVTEPAAHSTPSAASSPSKNLFMVWIARWWSAPAAIGAGAGLVAGILIGLLVGRFVRRRRSERPTRE